MTLPDFVSPLEGETGMAETHPSYWNYFWTIVLGVLLTPLVGVGLLFLAWACICVKTTSYIATSARVIAKTGWLNIHQTEVRIEDIRAVNVKRSFMQRILGIGDVAIGTAATEGAEIVMRSVVDPDGFVAQVNACRH